MGQGQSKRAILLARLALALVFLAALGGTAYWVIRSFIAEPKKTIVLAPDDTPPPRAPSAMPAPGTPAAAARRAARAPVVAGPPIGGFVQNENGEPIAAARVNFNWREMAGPNDPNPGRQTYKNGRATTNAKGHWTTRAVPPASIGALNFSIIQKDYAALAGKSSAKDLLADNSRFVMTRGLEVSGQVVSADGQPLMGASVGITANRNRNNTPTATTNSDGKFTLRHIAPDKDMAVTATMTGYAPGSQSLTLPAPAQGVRVVLNAGHTISGTVTDAAGNGVPDVTVELNSWMGNYRPVDMHATTDSQGKYALRHMPADAIELDANKQGWSGGNEDAGPAQDHVDFKISKALNMRGTVVDAITHQPIDNFRVVTGVKWTGNQAPDFQENTSRPFTGGRYQEVLGGFGGTIDSWFVRIEAKGYLPSDSGPLNQSGTQNFELKHGTDLIGHILAANGKPAAGIGVTIVGPNQQAYINDGEIQNQGGSRGMTDANGTFDLPPQVGRFDLVAAGPGGFAQVNQDALAKSADVHLTAWGGLQGRLMIGKKPGADETVDVQLDSQRIYVPNQPRVYYQLNVKTDADGHFTFDHVHPGQVRVSRIIMTPTSDNGFMWGYTSTEQATVSSGTTATVNLGGKGRAVVGRLIIPKELSDQKGWYFYANVNSIAEQLDPPQMPASLRNNPGMLQDLWLHTFLLTDAGKALLAAQKNADQSPRAYSPQIAADGTFRIDDVLPGRYQMTLWAQPARGGRMMGNGNGTFAMPPIPGGISDEPLKIDDITVKTQP